MKEYWRQKLGRSRYFVAAIFLHLLVFILIATYVVFPAAHTPNDATFQAVKIALPPPPPPSPPSEAGGGSVNPLEPTAVVTPPTQVPVAITSTSSSFFVPSPAVKIPSLPASMSAAQGSSLAGHSASGAGSGTGSSSSVFGSMSEGSNPEFIGYMYDLKQTPEGGKSDITADSYSNVIDDFLDRHWSDSVLSHYYKFDKPIHATQIFIPNMDASLGPAAFGAEEKIKPSCWVIHYKARVSPPTPGIYRFWGIADDIMAVAVDGRTVLAGNRSDTVLRKLTWKSSLPEGAQAADGKLRAGSWVQFQAGEAVNLDVIIGERPGGQFNAFMLVEKQGDNYQKDSDGNPILPIFQLAPKITPPDSALQKQPLFSTVPAIWTPQARDN